MPKMGRKSVDIHRNRAGVVGIAWRDMTDGHLAVTIVIDGVGISKIDVVQPNSSE